METGVCKGQREKGVAGRVYMLDLRRGWIYARQMCVRVSSPKVCTGECEIEGNRKEYGDECV